MALASTAMGDMLPDRIPTEPAPAARPLSSREAGRRARELLGVLGDLLKLAYRLVRDPRVPMRRRLVAGAALAYVVVPVDLIPDAIPGLGQTDDILVLALALRFLMEAAGPEVVAEHWDGEPGTLETVDAVVEWGADLVPRSVRRTLRRLLR